MTEAGWEACTDPRRMLEFLRGRVSDRKLHLFACACCRRIWDHLPDERSRQAVRLAERYADRLASFTLASFTQVCDVCRIAAARGTAVSTPGLVRWASEAAVYVANPTGRSAATLASLAGQAILGEAECVVQCALLRDLFGNPFRPVAFDPARLAWEGGTLRKLARVIDEEYRFGELPVLADALEDAGCADEAILSHCREPAAHVRGCWVVELLLGKG